MQDRQPGAPGQYKAKIADAELQKMQYGEPFVITMTRDDQPLVEGTPYNKASVLPDELAALICPDLLDPTPADAFRGLAKKTESLYPVGSIYLSVTNVSPASFVGGTWEQLKDRFLIGAGGGYSGGTTGGEAMNAHYHQMPVGYDGNQLYATTLPNGGGVYNLSGKYVPSVYMNETNPVYLSNTESAELNNMPPYLAVYMWKRIA